MAILDPVCSTDSKSGDLVLAATRQQEVVVLGRLQHMAVCSGLKKDGTPCSMITDTCISDRCMYHRHTPTTTTSHSQAVRAGPTAPSRPQVVQKKTPERQCAATEPVDLFDAVLHAKPKPKEVLRTAGKSADILAVGLDEEEGGGNIVTLDGSSDEDSVDESYNREKVGKSLSAKANVAVTSKGAALLGDSTSRRDGTVHVPQQSSVFGSVPAAFAKQQQQNRPLTTASMAGTDGIRRQDAMPVKSNNSLLNGTGLGGLYASRPSTTVKPATNTLYSKHKSDIIVGGENLLIDKSKLLSNAQSIAKMTHQNCPVNKRKAETAAEIAAKKRKQAIDDLLSRCGI